MKYFIFKNEQNDFDDILKDSILKKEFTMRIRWKNHLLLGTRSPELSKNLESYLNLKFGDIMVPSKSVIRDFSPTMFKDYHPGKLPKFPVNKKS